MMRSSIINRNESDYLTAELQNFNQKSFSPFLDLDAFQNIIMMNNNNNNQPNSTKSTVKPSQKKQSNTYKLQMKKIKTISNGFNNSSQKQPQLLTTLLKIKQQNAQFKKSSLASSSSTSKNVFKIHEMFKIDDFLNNKKHQQQSEIDLSCTSQTQRNPQGVDEKCATQTIPISDFIKYTLSDKSGSLTTRSLNINKNMFSPRENQQGMGYTTFFNTEQIVSPKSTITPKSITATKIVDQQKSTLTKILDQQKPITSEQSFVQIQRRLRPSHTVQNSICLNPFMLNSDQSAQKLNQKFQNSCQKPNQVSPFYKTANNATKNDCLHRKHSLIMNLLQNEKQQDTKLTKNYNQSVKVQSEIEIARKMSIPGSNQQQEKQSEELKQKFVKRILDSQQEGSFGGRKSSRERVHKLSITNPIFTEVDKSALADKSQMYLQHQLKNQSTNIKTSNGKKLRIQSAQTKFAEQKNAASNTISSSFFNFTKDHQSNLLQNQNLLKEEEEGIEEEEKLNRNQKAFIYHIKEQNNTSIQQFQNSSKETQQKRKIASPTLIKQNIHPELQSYNYLIKRPSKELLSQINLPASTNNLKTSNKLTSQSKKKVELEHKSNPAKRKSIFLQKSKTLEEEQNIKEATNNLAIYKYSSNYYRPQTAKIFSSSTTVQKQEKAHKKSYNSLKSWENNDNEIDDQSGYI